MGSSSLYSQFPRERLVSGERVCVCVTWSARECVGVCLSISVCVYRWYMYVCLGPKGSAEDRLTGDSPPYPIPFPFFVRLVRDLVLVDSELNTSRTPT